MFLQTGSTSWTNLKQCYKNDDNDNNVDSSEKK